MLVFTLRKRLGKRTSRENVYRPRYNVTYNRFVVLFFIGLYCYRLNNQCVTCCAERGTATNSTATDCCHCHPETGKRKHVCDRIINYNKDMTLIKSSAFHGCVSVRVHLKKTRIDVKTWCRKVFSKKIHHPPSQPINAHCWAQTDSWNREWKGLRIGFHVGPMRIENCTLPIELFKLSRFPHDGYL